jgi:predicted nucleotidyltransferase
VPLPPFNENGDLAVGVHRATLRETIARFGTENPQRMIVALRLEHIYRLAMATAQVARFLVFGSFVTAKNEPNDVDVFMLMEDTFDIHKLTGETRLLFGDHLVAQSEFGASVFWLRRLAAFGGEQATIKDWGHKRDGSERGIVEIIPETL